MRRRFRLGIGLLAIYATGCFGAAIFAGVTLQPYRRPLPGAAENQMRRTPAGLQSELQDVRMAAFDDAPLRAWFIHPHRGNGDAVILLHGLGDNRLGMVGYAEMLLDHGYSVLMPDARAHGISGGMQATYGLVERDDVRHWFEWLKGRQHPHCIYGLGESMGVIFPSHIL